MRVSTDDVDIELLAEVRALALQMVRFETWAREAAERNRWQRVAECHTQRDLARGRRSQLMRELWEARRR
jgi:hypothetical protein